MRIWPCMLHGAVAHGGVYLYESMTSVEEHREHREEHRDFCSTEAMGDYYCHYIARDH